MRHFRKGGLVVWTAIGDEIFVRLSRSSVPWGIYGDQNKKRCQGQCLSEYVKLGQSQQPGLQGAHDRLGSSLAVKGILRKEKKKMKKKSRVQDQTRDVLTLGSHSGGTQKGRGGRQSDSETRSLPKGWLNACLGPLCYTRISIEQATWRIS